MRKKPIKFESAEEAIPIIDQMINNKDEGLVDTTPVGPIRKGLYLTVVIDDVLCPVCHKFRDTIWKCQECDRLICYGCLIDKHTRCKLPRGEFLFKCICGSRKLFLKHNIMTTPMGFR